MTPKAKAAAEAKNKADEELRTKRKLEEEAKQQEENAKRQKQEEDERKLATKTCVKWRRKVIWMSEKKKWIVKVEGELED